MLLIITKGIIGLIMAITGYYVVKKILLIKTTVPRYKVLISLIAITLPTLLVYDKNYSIILTVLVFAVMIITFKSLFKLEVATSILACGYVMLITALVDVCLTIAEIPIFSYNQVRTTWYISILNNIIIGIIAVVISSNKKIINTFTRICNKVEKSSKIKSIIFTVVILLAMSLLYYNITTIFKFNLQYTVTFFSIILFFILYGIYIGERNNYEKLRSEYNIIFNYVQTFEDWIDNEQMYRHELKNNLSIIRNLTNKDEINEKIDKMLNMNMNIDDKYIEGLKNVPKGGLKGLLYYKIAIGLKNKINIYTDVSPKVRNKLAELNKQMLETICIILGVYLDNAIEACYNEKSKNITIEIYENNNNIIFAISNTCSKVVSIQKMNKKGYTTKGQNHGQGLYFVNKLIRKEKNISVNQAFLNNFFIQKIIINCKKNC